MSNAPLLLEKLAIREQAMVLAALLHQASRDDIPLRFNKISGEPGQRCLQAFHEVQNLNQSEKNQLVKGLAKRLFAPLPANVERIHPSWIAQAIKSESATIASIFKQGLPPSMREMIKIEQPNHLTSQANSPIILERVITNMVLRNVVPMMPLINYPTNTWAPTHLEELGGWPPERIISTITHLGYLMLAYLARHTPGELQQRLFSHFNSTQLNKVQQAIDLRLDISSPKSLLTPDLAQDLLSAQLSSEILLFTLGASLLQQALPQLLLQQIALLLPREIGIWLITTKKGGPAVKNSNSAEPFMGNADQENIRVLIQRADAWARGISL